MKTRLSPIVVLALATALAPALSAETPSFLETHSGDKMYKYIGFDNGGSPIVKSLRLGFEEYTASSTLYGAATFDLLHVNGGIWEWNWNNGTTSATSMELTHSGIATLWGPAVSSYRPWVEINPTGAKITFGHTLSSTPTSPTTLGALSYDSTLKKLLLTTPTLIDPYWETHALVTTADPIVQAITLHAGSALTLGEVHGVLGTGSFAGGVDAEVYGANSLAFGSGARAGDLNWNGTSWQGVGTAADNAVALGANSFAAASGAMAFGANSYAAASGAMALGTNSSAAAVGTMAFGTRALATTKQSIAIGEDSEASGVTYGWDDYYFWGSVAFGTQAKATGTNSVAVGSKATAASTDSTAMGLYANVSPDGVFGTAVGWRSITSNHAGLALGANATSSGWEATSVGSSTFAKQLYSSVLGQYADATSTGQVVLGVAPLLPTPSTDMADQNATILVLGAGQPPTVFDYNQTGTAQWTNIQRKTALSVKRNGNLTAEGTVTANGTATGTYSRFKAPVLVAPGGDISMGGFESGTAP